MKNAELIYSIGDSVTLVTLKDLLETMERNLTGLLEVEFPAEFKIKEMSIILEDISALKRVISMFE